MVGGVCGCVEVCYRESDVEGGCCGGYIHVGVPLCCVQVNVWDMYCFFNEIIVFGLGL